MTQAASLPPDDPHGVEPHRRRPLVQTPQRRNFDTGASAPLPNHLSDWARQRERGRSFPLRLMAWVTLRVSQGLAELLLVPIAGWFLVASPAARAASRDYLRRALGRPPRSADVARHFLAFAQVILDRAYFLAGRAERYRTETEGLHHLLDHLKSGRGCVLLGAHLGSFDAMRALGREAPVRVRPAMFRANAGALTAILERLDPALAAQIIDLGRPEAMLAVRESLAAGEIVAFLADRATDSRRLAELPFFGSPARFPTGPFQIAALLGAPAIMILGVRTGRRRYLLRFEPLPDAATPVGSDDLAAILPVMNAYVARLEAACRAYPLQWFNFYSFWRLDRLPNTPRQEDSPAGARARFPPLSLSCAGIGGFLLAAAPAHAADETFGLLNGLMPLLAAPTARQSTFHEEKTVAHLTRPLSSSGILIWRRPDYLEKRTLSPIQEDLVVEGRRASVTAGGNAPYVLDLDAHADLRVLIDTLRGVLSGNLVMLRADFEVTAEGTLPAWLISLRPKSGDAKKLLRAASVSGRAGTIREIRLLLPNGTADVLTVDGG